MDQQPTFSSIGPQVWGRSFWEFLDAIVATYPRENPSVEQRTAVRDLFQSLRYVLPCPTCRHHYNEFVRTHPIEQALSSRKSLVDFYFMLKKDIAVRTGKPLPSHSPEELWQHITRRLKLVPHGPVHVPLAKASASPRLSLLQRTPPLRDGKKTVFRVPARMRNNAAATAVVKKGCGCGGKK